jgi:hypothetical protein
MSPSFRGRKAEYLPSGDVPQPARKPPALDSATLSDLNFHPLMFPSSSASNPVISPLVNRPGPQQRGSNPFLRQNAELSPSRLRCDFAFPLDPAGS